MKAERGFGTLSDGDITVHQGDMFAAPEPTARRLALADVRTLTPTRPSKMIALWNNFRALGAKLGIAAAGGAALSAEGGILLRWTRTRPSGGRNPMPARSSTKASSAS